jgi:hypothetical protein
VVDAGCSHRGGVLTDPTPSTVRQAIELLARERQAVADADLAQVPAVFAASPKVATLVDVGEVGSWLGDSNLRYPMFEVIQSGVEQPVDKITRARVVLGKVESGFPDPVAIGDLLRRGATVQVSEVEAWHPAVRRFCLDLQRITRLRVGAVVFLSGPGGGGYGLPAHSDLAHAVAVQVAGEKRWEVGVALDDEPTGSLDVEDSQQFATVTLTPGQALYVPLGRPHRASAGPSGSLHLSITIRPIALSEAMRDLTSPLWSLPSDSEYMDGTRDERVRQIADLLAGVASWAQQQSPESVLDRLEKRWIGSADGVVDPLADVLDGIGPILRRAADTV